ncbi:MAG: tail fiber domain-containing protein [Bacteroidia bacterium]|nr:tail fiber domain-containing protein [Bacteroidia bacterium]
MKTRNLLTVSIILAIVFIVFTLNVKAQNIGINSTGATPNSSAMLDIDVSALASKKGLLIPRMTNAEKTALVTLPEAAQGLMIYQTDGIQGFYYNTSTTTTPSWNYLPPSTTGGWSTTGNLGTDPTINFIGTIDNKDLVIKTNNYEVMRITTSGKVGINESNPNSSLQIKTYANGIITNPFDGIKIQSPLNTNYNRGTLLGIEDGSISGVMGQNAQLWNFEPGFLRFGTQDVERMRIDKDGWFGFNEPNPVSVLTVRPYINGVGASYDGIRIIHPTYASNTTNGLLLGVDIMGNNAALTYFQTGDLNITANAGNMNFATNGFDRMKITTFGQVTIGNTNPLATLSIQDNVGVQPGLMVTTPFLAPGSNGMLFGLNQWAQNNGKIWNYMSGDIEIGTNGNEIIRLSSNGKVGIGTTSPQEILHVVGNTRISSLAGGTTRVLQADANGTIVALADGTPSQVLLGTGVWGPVPGSGNDWSLMGNGGTIPGTDFIGTYDVNDLVFKTNNTERIRIMSGGKVGIGTNNPLSELHVVGNTRISSLSGTGNRMIQADANGTLIQMTAGAASEVLLGTGVWGTVPGAGNDWSLTGNAGTNATVNFIGTTDNTDLVFRRNNYLSGLINNSAQNTSWGYGALNETTTGISNTAIGNSAMHNITNGNYNTAIGVNALHYMESGSNNSVFGDGALFNNQSGSRNTVLGQNALFFNSNGKSNTVIGVNALYANINGNYNTASGDSAGFNSLGSNNIFVGFQSGDNLTIGNKNIIIGDRIDLQSSTASNQLNIGNIIFGTNINGIGTNMSTGNIGIGKKDPQTRLVVSSITDRPNYIGQIRCMDDANLIRSLNLGFQNTDFAAFIQTDKAGVDPFYPYLLLQPNNGNVGIGTFTPSLSAKLEIAGQIKITGGSPGLGKALVSDATGLASWQTLAGLGTAWGLSGNAGTVAGTNYIGTTDAIDLVFKTNSIEWMRVMSGGNIGIGVAGPSQKLHVLGNVYAESGGYKVFNATNDLYRSSVGKYGGVAAFDFNSVSTASGIVLENGETESGGFYADGDMAGIWAPGDNDLLKLWDEDGMILRARLDGSGNWYALTNNATSDARLKKNIRPLESSLNKILSLNGKVFDWREEILFKGEIDAGKPVSYDELKNKIGFIAQELELVLPEVVTINKNTGYKAVNYEAIIPVVTEAIKEQQKQIEALKTIVAEQQKQINQLLKN